jgi:hypothetical protein
VQEGERGERNKRKRESCWKNGGGRTRLYTWRRTGLADEVAIPDAAGGEGGHGAAKSDGVIHSTVGYISKKCQPSNFEIQKGFADNNDPPQPVNVSHVLFTFLQRCQ